MNVERAIVTELGNRTCGSLGVAYVLDQSGARTGERLLIDNRTASLAEASQEHGEVVFLGVRRMPIAPGRSLEVVWPRRNENIVFVRRSDDPSLIQWWLSELMWQNAEAKLSTLPYYRVVRKSDNGAREPEVVFGPTRNLAALSMQYPRYTTPDGTFDALDDPDVDGTLIVEGQLHTGNWIPASKLSDPRVCVGSSCFSPDLYKDYRTEATPEQPQCEHHLVSAS